MVKCAGCSRWAAHAIRPTLKALGGLFPSNRQCLLFAACSMRWRRSAFGSKAQARRCARFRLLGTDSPQNVQVGHLSLNMRSSGVSRRASTSSMDRGCCLYRFAPSPLPASWRVAHATLRCVPRRSSVYRQSCALLLTPHENFAKVRADHPQRSCDRTT